MSDWYDRPVDERRKLMDTAPDSFRPGGFDLGIQGDWVEFAKNEQTGDMVYYRDNKLSGKRQWYTQRADGTGEFGYPPDMVSDIGRDPGAEETPEAPMEPAGRGAGPGALAFDDASYLEEPVERAIELLKEGRLNSGQNQRYTSKYNEEHGTEYEDLWEIADAERDNAAQ